MREIVVTRGLGFIGSHVVEAYLARGDRVRITDSSSPVVRVDAPTAGVAV
jgi:nucleoside-diphosphate-sugar epimerase